MTLEFNEYLKSECKKINVPVKDITKLMILPDGSTDQKFIMEDIHLSQEAMPLLINEFSDIINEQTKN
jgi:hypothetical protein